MSGPSEARRAVVLDPSPPGVHGGNRVTALRWARVLRGEGWRVRVRGTWDAEPAELLVVLHALKGAASVRRWRERRGDAPLVVALTGTDFEAGADRTAALASLRSADAVVVLFEGAGGALRAALDRPVHVVPQSFRGCDEPPPPVEAGVVLALLANLRPVKDPLLAPRALALRPSLAGVRLDVAGSVLDEASGAAMQAAAEHDERVRWLGPLRRREALAVLTRSHALLCTSRHEGGAGAVGEALAFGRAVLSTDLPACRALLGADHPGLFPVGDAEALAWRIERFVADAGYRDRLTAASRARADRVSPARERAAWRALLDELHLGREVESR